MSTPEIEKAEALFNAQHMLILSGLPGSGKTTEAMRWVVADPENRMRVNYDEIRLKMFGENWQFNRAQEDLMKDEAHRMAIEALGEGKSVCIDNTNLTPKARTYWVTLANAAGVPIQFQEVDTPVYVCCERDRQRDGRKRVGRAVIERMALFNGFIDWDDKEVYPRDFIVVDMDGTVADCNWRRDYVTPRCTKCHKDKKLIKTPVGEACLYCGHNEFSKKDWPSFFRGCGDDQPIMPIIELARMLGQSYDILVVSGRPINLAGKQTEDWLRTHMRDLPVRHLFMRPDDGRDDDIVKEEILDLLPQSRIAYVLDDRDRVVKMWRRRGLTCLQVANGDF